MRHLYKMYYEKNDGDFHEIYQSRFNFDSTVHLDLHIKPVSQPHIYNLYYVPTNGMLKMISKIHFISAEFERIFKNLPKFAQNQFINECLVEELYNTNELEGRNCTREEIAKSVKEVHFNKKSRTRYEGLIQSYLRLLENDIGFPKVVQDIRKIYDYLTNGEMDQELPDGEIFRKEATDILKKSGSGKVVHQRITPEKEIIHAVDQLLKFMNENDEIPSLIKTAIGHYYFGYIHPFYDGNGRTSRFISSMFLSKGLGNLPTLSLSRGCNKFKNKYLEAFEITNTIKNRGEMNCFIESFLEMVLEGHIQMNADLKEKSELFNIAVKKLKHDPKLKSKEHFKEVMFVLAQNHFFDLSSGLTIKELSEICTKSEATMRKIMKQLFALSLIDREGEKPIYYFIEQKYFEAV